MLEVFRSTVHRLNLKQQQGQLLCANFQRIADLITIFMGSEEGAFGTDILAAALTAFLEVSCAEGIRWLRQQYCAAENTANVLHSALRELFTGYDCNAAQAVPLTAAALEVLLEAGAVAQLVRLDGVQGGDAGLAYFYVTAWWRLVTEGCTTQASPKRQAQCRAAAKVLLAAVEPSHREALLMPDCYGRSIVITALELRDAELLALLLSGAGAAVVRAVLCTAGNTVLLYTARACCNTGWILPRYMQKLTPCITVLIDAAHAAGSLHDVLSAQDAAGITAATWLLRMGYTDHVELLPPDSSLKHKGQWYLTHTLLQYICLCGIVCA
jgi:hypothetical protein